MSILSYTSFTKKYPGDKRRLKRMMRELQLGFRFLENFKCDRVVTFFGASLTQRTTKEYKEARKLAQKLATEGITIMTGGGPGIMEAANRGAYDVGGRSAGLNIHLADQERKNFYVGESVGFHYFFARKIMLVYSAQGFVFFPGGFGTMDEFFEISTLIATNKLQRKIPIVLVGKEFWNSLIKLMRDEMVEDHHVLDPKRFGIYSIVDTVEEAFEILKNVEVDTKRCELI